MSGATQETGTLSRFLWKFDATYPALDFAQLLAPDQDVERGLRRFDFYLGK
jgi:hypothetical protein